MAASDFDQYVKKTPFGLHQEAGLGTIEFTRLDKKVGGHLTALCAQCQQSVTASDVLAMPGFNHTLTPNRGGQAHHERPQTRSGETGRCTNKLQKAMIIYGRTLMVTTLL